MGLIGWLVAIGCLLIGAAVGIWGFTEVNRSIPIWLVGFPGALCLIVALGFEFQNLGIEKSAAGDPNRPWVGVERIDMDPLNPGDLKLFVRFRNAGGSPALHVRLLVQYNILKTDEPAPVIAEIPELATENVIFPNVSVSSPLFQKGGLTPFVHDLQESKLTLWVSGRVRYADQHGGIHNTVFQSNYLVNENRFAASKTIAD